MHQLIFSSAFQRQVTKLLKKNSCLKPKIATCLKHLRVDVHQPSLQLHKLSGQQNWSVTVTRDIRIIIHWEEDRLYCLRIGTHDNVY